jgi:hypothetical protein
LDRESLVRDIPAGDGKTITFFLQWKEYVIFQIQTDKPGHFSISFIILFATAHVTLQQQQLLQALDKYQQQEAYTVWDNVTFLPTQ